MSEYGSTSCLITLYGPMNACRPMRQNWCTPLNGLTSAQSSMMTWPASAHAVAEDHVVADAHVVRHVRVGHQQVVVADGGDQAAALRCRDGW